MHAVNRASPDPRFELLNDEPAPGYPLITAPLVRANWPNICGTMVLLRHAETAENASNLIVGHIDPILPQDKLPDIRAVASRLSGVSGLQIMASDLRRAQMTAAIIADAANTPCGTSALLREADFGELDGLSKDSVEYRRDTASRRTDKYTFRPAGGESYEDMEGRITAFLSKLHIAHDDVLLVVTHIGALRVMYRILCDADPKIAADLDLGHLSASILNFRSGVAVWGARL